MVVGKKKRSEDSGKWNWFSNEQHTLFHFKDRKRENQPKRKENGGKTCEIKLIAFSK